MAFTHMDSDRLHSDGSHTHTDTVPVDARACVSDCSHRAVRGQAVAQCLPITARVHYLPSPL